MYFLGKIESPSGAASSNLVTGASGAVPFALPAQQQNVYLSCDVSGALFEFGFSGFLTSATRAAPLAGPNVLNGPFRHSGSPRAISVIRTDGGCAVRVFIGPVA